MGGNYLKHICTVVMLVCVLFCLCSCHREKRESVHTDLVLWDDVYQIQYLTPPDTGGIIGFDGIYFLKNNAFFIDDCLFLSSDYCAKADSVVQNILDEELSAVTAGIRTKEDAAKIIQSHVSIYLSE